jgi:hypothetical protein
MNDIAEMMDTFFNGRPAPSTAKHAEALRLLRGMHDRYHCEECICVVANFLRENLPPTTKGKSSERTSNRR